MKPRSSINPVLIELIVVILFFSLSAMIVVQVLGAANRTSLQSRRQSDALIALEDMAEAIKADPEGCPFNGDTAVWQAEYGDIVCDASVTREQGAAGAYYTISLTALHGEETLLTLDAARYVKAEVAG